MVVEDGKPMQAWCLDDRTQECQKSTWPLNIVDSVDGDRVACKPLTNLACDLF
jgi:hypothetical protein